MELNFNLGLSAAETESFIRASRSFTLFDQLRKTARMYPDRVAVSEPARTLTYRELDERSNRLANGLRERGVKPETSTVAVLSENRGETVVLAYACAKLGCLLGTLNWRLERQELVHCSNLITPDILVASGRFREKSNWILDDGVGEPTLCEYDGGGDVAFSDLIDAGVADDPYPESHVHPEQGFAVLNTSGTTGLPKGVVVSHRAILRRIVQVTIDYGLERGDNYPAWGPMFHPAGITWMGVTAAVGGTFYPIDGFSPERIVDVLLASDRPISWLFLVPGVVDRLVSHVERRNLVPGNVPTIRTMGALPDMIDPETIRRVTEAFDAPFQNTYGAAENGHVASGDKIPVGVAPDEDDLAKHESPFVAVKMIDDRWNRVADREAEMAVRGPSLTSGYIRNEEANRENFDQGWFRTGDIFAVHDDGTYSFVSRRKYLIKPGGENVYPAELEEVIAAHEAVKEVVVVRADDDEWGEVPRAVVAAETADADQLRGELMERLDAELARYKLPHYIKVVDPSWFDRSATGKIVRTDVEEWEVDIDERVRDV